MYSVFSCSGSTYRIQKVFRIHFCSHIEADTRIIYHLSILADLSPQQNVIVRATDTDIMVLLLHYAPKLDSNIWMDLGHTFDNTRRLVNITALSEHIGPIFCKALPG